MARKIVIASGKGGAGKSSLAAGLGGALAGMGKHILLIDCDIGLRSLDLILGCAENTVYDWADVLLGRCAPEKAPLSVGRPSSSRRAFARHSRLYPGCHALPYRTVRCLF